MNVTVYRIDNGPNRDLILISASGDSKFYPGNGTLVSGINISSGSGGVVGPDLQAIELLTGTDTIYYRSASDTWSPVSIGTGISFTGGLLRTSLDNDLTALAALTGTSTIYYRSATDTWSPVTVGTPLSFSAGTLSTDADLAALEALTGTGTIYYRSAANTWSPITIGSGITFTTGNLSSSVSAVLDGDLNAIAELTGTGTLYYRSATDTWTPVTFSGMNFTTGLMSPYATDVLIENVRPVFNHAGYLGYSNAEYLTYLAGQKNYRNTPIYVSGGSLITSNRGFNFPFVASTSMCNTGNIQPYYASGASSRSTNALISDPYLNLVVSGTGASQLILTGAGIYSQSNSTGTFLCSPLDRALPTGFQLVFYNTGYTLNRGVLHVMSTVNSGATSIPVSTLYSAVSLSGNDFGLPLNAYLHQAGVPSSIVRDVQVIGHPATSINYDWATYEGSRRYNCDGISISAIGTRVINCQASNFPGHGFYITYPLSSATLSGPETGFDTEAILVDDLIAHHCLCGITLAATDTKAGKMVAHRCRDIGIQILGAGIHTPNAHAYGCGTGIYSYGNVYNATYQGENCNYGVVFGSNASRSSVDTIRAYTNTRLGVKFAGSVLDIGCCLIDHSSTTQTNSDVTNAGYDGWAAIINSYADYSKFHNIDIQCSNSASGLSIGSYNPSTKALTFTKIHARIGGTAGGGVGTYIICPLVNCDIDFTVDGFARGILFHSAATPSSGNTITFRGANTTNITWPDSTTGTLATPNIPTGLAAYNSISIIPNGARPTYSPLTVQNGGTSATGASQARTNLGLAIGTDIHGYNNDLAAIASLTGSGVAYYRSGAGTWNPIVFGSGTTFNNGTLTATITGGLGPDLTALEATNGTNILYYRESDGSWKEALPTGDLTTRQTYKSVILDTNTYSGHLIANGIYDLQNDAFTFMENSILYQTSSADIQGLSPSVYVFPITNGGTAATTTAGARANLGLTIGTNVQAYDADLTSLSNAAAVDSLYYRSAASTWSPVTVNSGIVFSGGNLSSTIKKSITFSLFGPNDIVTSGNNKAMYSVPPGLSGSNLTYAHAYVNNTGMSGTTNIMITRTRTTGTGVGVTSTIDMLSSALILESGKNGTENASSQYVINTTGKDLKTYDILRVNITGVSAVPPTGLLVTLESTWGLY